MATYEEQLLEREKTLAGFHPTHYIRESLIAEIAILKVKAQEERSELEFYGGELESLEARLSEEQKIKAGFHPQHSILSSGRFDTIPLLIAKIKQKKTRN